MEKDPVSPVPQSRERHLMCDLLIFRKLLRGHLMYTGKGSIQEVMGLPPRSVTNPGTLATWGSLPVAFRKPLSQRGHKEKSLVKYDLQMWSLACMLFFLQFEFKDFRGKGERATRLLLPQPPSLFCVANLASKGICVWTSCPLSIQPPASLGPSAQYFSARKRRRFSVSASIGLFPREPQTCLVPGLTT